MSADALVRHVVTFGRVLREAGLEVGPGRVADALTALDAVDLGRQDDVYWSLRTTMITRFEEIEPFDRAFSAWFLRAPVAPEARLAVTQPPRRGVVRRGDPIRGADRRDDPDPLEISSSAVEVLRRRDFATMTPEEFAQARALIRKLAVARPRRRSRRMRPHSRGAALDLRRRAVLAQLSPPARGPPPRGRAV